MVANYVCYGLNTAIFELDSIAGPEFLSISLHFILIDSLRPLTEVEKKKKTLSDKTQKTMVQSAAAADSK